MVHVHRIERHIRDYMDEFPAIGRVKREHLLHSPRAFRGRCMSSPEVQCRFPLVFGCASLDSCHGGGWQSYRDTAKTGRSTYRDCQVWYLTHHNTSGYESFSIQLPYESADTLPLVGRESSSETFYRIVVKRLGTNCVCGTEQQLIEMDDSMYNTRRRKRETTMKKKDKKNQPAHGCAFATFPANASTQGTTDGSLQGMGCTRTRQMAVLLFGNGGQ